LILVDAPCSGLGTLARHPDIRWRARPEELARHARRQHELLEALAPLLTPGGLLVYAVCSLEPEEAFEMASAFQAAHPELETAELPRWCERFRADSFVGLLPERDGGDGFFAAAFRRR
jgi:16S rRNA (cytosine967-C5)-methyltransferase